MSEQEIDAMLRLAPFEETRVAKDYIKRGKKIGQSAGYTNLLPLQIERNFGITLTFIEKLLADLSNAQLEELALQVIGMTKSEELFAWLEMRSVGQT